MLSILVFVVLLLIRVPIFVVLGITGLTYIITSGNIGLLETTPQTLFASMESFSLLAIPMFVLAGELMNFGGVTKRLIRFANAIIGHYKGGLVYVNIVANTFLASILGSSLAQTAMMSRIMVPEMVKSGYKRDFSTATTAAAAMLGPIIPPSMTFIIYSVSAETSISAMFLAGIVPGLLLALAFILYIAFLGYKSDFPTSDKSSAKEMVKALIDVIPALSVPIIIVGGILTGVFTATESAAIACVVALIAGVFIYKELKIREIPNLLIQTGLVTAIVTTLIAMANLFGLAITFERLPHLIGETMVAMTDNALVFLVLVNILLLLIGMVMDGIAVLIIIVPILVPIATTFEIDLVHFGVIMCLNLVIGSLIPPVGAGLFIASSVAQVKIEKLIRALVPFLIVSLIVLIIVTYLPDLVMWIPNMMADS